MSVKYGYVPLHPPQKDVSFERMQEILRKHTPIAAQSPTEKSGVKVWPAASEKPAEPPRPRSRTPLQWQKPEAGSTGVRTVCEWYSCCKVQLAGVWQYEVWTREPLTGGMKQLAVGLTDWRDARKVAQADADKAGETNR